MFPKGLHATLREYRHAFHQDWNVALQRCWLAMCPAHVDAKQGMKGQRNKPDSLPSALTYKQRQSEQSTFCAEICQSQIWTFVPCITIYVQGLSLSGLVGICCFANVHCPHPRKTRNTFSPICKNTPTQVLTNGLTLLILACSGHASGAGPIDSVALNALPGSKTAEASTTN